MGYRLEITNTKNKKNDRIEKNDVENMMEAVQVLQNNLVEMLEDIKGRDSMVDVLEKEIEALKAIIKEQQERIEDRDKKIERLENESQKHYDEKCEVIAKLEKVTEEKCELKEKVDKLLDILK